MKVTKDLRELIRRKLERANDKKTKKKKEEIQKKLKPLSNKLNKFNEQIENLHKEAKKVGKEMGAYNISLYGNQRNYISLEERYSFDIDEEFYKILEEIELGENPCLKDIFNRIDKL